MASMFSSTDGVSFSDATVGGWRMEAGWRATSARGSDGKAGD